MDFRTAGTELQWRRHNEKAAPRPGNTNRNRALFRRDKLEAFKGRGGGSFLGSRDLEDAVLVIDGRETLRAEVKNAGGNLQEYVRGEIANLLARPGFIDALPGFLLPDAASQSRIGIVLGRLRDLASL